MLLDLQVQRADGTTKMISYDVKKLLNVGRTARDIEDTKKHLEELRKGGANLSDDIPVVHPKVKDLITTASSVEVYNDQTSGEAEYVILLDESDIYIGVGSDHTDRELQKVGSGVAKMMCPNVLAPTVWLYEDIKNEWDQLIMRSYVEKDGERSLYQEDVLGSMMRPEDVISEVKERVEGGLDGAVIFAGTFPTLSGNICFADLFDMEIENKQTGRKLKHFYHVNPIKWYKKKK